MSFVAAVRPAQAKIVKFPEHHPEVALDVPDNWSVSYTAVGLELRSPEKNSVIVANLFKHNKAAAEAWPKQAKQALTDAGVVTVEKAQKPAPAIAPSPSSLPTLAAPSGDRFTFSGMPAAKMPGGLAPIDGTTAPLATVAPGAAPTGASSRNKIPHKIVNYQDANFDGKPTDVQLYIFSLTRDDLFLIEQQSGKSDNRAVDIVYSVQPVH